MLDTILTYLPYLLLPLFLIQISFLVCLMWKERKEQRRKREMVKTYMKEMGYKVDP